MAQLVAFAYRGGQKGDIHGVTEKPADSAATETPVARKALAKNYRKAAETTT